MGLEFRNILDYYPFGMQIPGRSFSPKEYRFGFHTQERSDELHQNHYTAEYWEYDSRIGRRWNQDPKPNPSISNYAAFANNPIFYTDVLGDSINVSATKSVDASTKSKDDDYTDLVINDWEEQAGLNIDINKNGNLTYSINENTKDFSQTQRDYLTGMMDDENLTQKVEYGDDTRYDPKTHTVTLNAKEIQLQINGASTELNPKTMGWGLSTMHELLHEKFGGHSGSASTSGVKSPKWFGYRDALIDKMNVIRFELTSATAYKYGLQYGTRMTYVGIDMAGYHIFPFDGNSYEAIQTGKNKTQTFPTSNQLHMKFKYK